MLNRVCSSLLLCVECTMRIDCIYLWLPNAFNRLSRSLNPRVEQRRIVIDWHCHMLTWRILLNIAWLLEQKPLLLLQFLISCSLGLCTFLERIIQDLPRLHFSMRVEFDTKSWCEYSGMYLLITGWCRGHFETIKWVIGITSFLVASWFMYPFIAILLILRNRHYAWGVHLLHGITKSIENVALYTCQWILSDILTADNCPLILPRWDYTTEFCF